MKKVFTVLIFVIMIISSYFLYDQYNNNFTVSESDKPLQSYMVQPLELMAKIPGAHWRYAGITEGSLSIIYSGAEFGNAYFFPAIEKTEIILPESEGITILLERIDKDTGTIIFKFKEDYTLN